jgi:DNA adenine methylase
MQYVGSKYNLKNELIPLITRNLTPERCYVEPFSGGLNIIRHIKHSKRIAADNNKYLVAMWKALQNGWQPKPNYTKEEYEDIKNDYENGGNKYPDFVKGFCGYCCSFRGLFFHSYAHNDGIREFQNLAMYRCLIGTSRDKKKGSKKININNIQFQNLDFTELNIPQNSVVYCDAPYRSTTTDGYADAKDFDYEKYYNWLRRISKDNEVYISEQMMPDDFEIIYEKEYTCQLSKNKHTTTERLYRLKQPEQPSAQNGNINLAAVILALLHLSLLNIQKRKTTPGNSNDFKIICHGHFKIIFFCSNSPPFSDDFLFLND